MKRGRHFWDGPFSALAEDFLVSCCLSLPQQPSLQCATGLSMKRLFSMQQPPFTRRFGEFSESFTVTKDRYVTGELFVPKIANAWVRIQRRWILCSVSKSGIM